MSQFFLLFELSKVSFIKFDANVKKEALQWGRDFISQADGSLDMKFRDVVALYVKDAESCLRETTLDNKHYLFKKKVLPHFGLMPINAIKPTDIRNWQRAQTTMEIYSYLYPNKQTEVAA